MRASQFLRRFFEPGRPERAILLSVSLGAGALANQARLHNALARRGVRRPKFAVAAAVTALVLACEAPGAIVSARRARAARARLVGGEWSTEHDVSLGEVPAGARALITGMLDFSADPGSKALRSQLEGAREKLWATHSGAYSTIELDVADAEGLPRVVPHQQVFPVIAEFDDPRSGDPRKVRLEISDGQLARLRIEEAAEPAALPESEQGLWPSPWPALAEVVFSIESDAPSDARAARLVQRARSL